MSAEEDGKGPEESKEETRSKASEFGLDAAAAEAKQKRQGEDTEETSKTDETESTSSTNTTENTDPTPETGSEAASTPSKTEDTDDTEVTEPTGDVDEVLDLKVPPKDVNGYSLPGELVTDGAIRNVPNLNMYVGDEWTEVVSELYEDLNYEHRKVHGEEIEKNREFYPALLTVLFQNLDEFRDALDLDPSGRNTDYEP